GGGGLWPPRVPLEPKRLDPAALFRAALFFWRGTSLGDELIVDAQAARAALVLDGQWVVGAEFFGQHSVRDRADAFVVVEIALAAASEALDGVGVEPVGLDEATRGIARGEHGHQGALLLADGELDVLLGADRLGDLLA